MTNYIWITTQFEGFHSYKNAPKEVEFLRLKHRHLFKVKMLIEVFHDDREIEFIIFKRFIETVIKNTNLNNLSCEQIANKIYKRLEKKYNHKRKIKIEVSEDGENGCLMEYE